MIVAKPCPMTTVIEKRGCRNKMKKPFSSDVRRMCIRQIGKNG